jgi:hypothetical protein
MTSTADVSFVFGTLAIVGVLAGLAVSCAAVGPVVDVFLPLVFLPSFPCYGYNICC